MKDERTSTQPTGDPPRVPARATDDTRSHEPSEEVSKEHLHVVRETLAGKVRRTPVLAWPEDEVSERFGKGTELLLKLEILQHASCFKTRGVMLHMLNLGPDQRARGVIAASAGNHAACVAFAAHAAGVSAKVVVPRTTSPARLEVCRRYGAHVVEAEDIHAAFAEMERLQEREGRVVVHSFDNPWMILGAADVAGEFVDQAGRLDVMVVAVGGGGLCGGSAAAMHVLQPDCEVYGVEPSGADTMVRSLVAGEVQRLQGATIADSLAAPFSCERTLVLCRKFARGIVSVEDTEILDGLRSLFSSMKLAVEPAAAAALAAVRGPLSDRVRGRRVGIVLCGSNIEPRTYADFLASAPRSRNTSAET
jgi:threonine dehydratase